MYILANVQHGDPGIAAAVVALGRDDLIVMISVDIQTGVAPGVKVTARLHGAAGPLVDADRPVLVKGPYAVDARRVVTSALAEPVGATVAGHRTQGRGIGRRVVGAEVLDDVVLDKGVAGPAVDGEVAVPVGLVRARVLDGPVCVC